MAEPAPISPAAPTVATKAGRRRAELFAISTIAIFVGGFALTSILLGEGQVMTQLSSLSLQLLAGMLGLSLANYMLRVLRWHIFSRASSICLPLSVDALYYVAGFALTATPGKMGEALRLWLLKRGHAIPYTRSISLLVADRLSDMAAIVMLAAAGIAAFSGYTGAVALALALVAMITAVFLRPDWLEVVLAAVSLKARHRPTMQMPSRFSSLLERVRTTLRHAAALASWRIYGGTLAMALVGWLAESGAFWLLLRHFGAPISFVQATFIFCFSMAVGAVSMLPGGLGGAEATMVALLIACDVDNGTAIAATGVIRATTLWFAILLGFGALPTAMRRAGSGSGVGASEKADEETNTNTDKDIGRGNRDKEHSS